MASRSRKKLFIDGTVQGALVKRVLLHWTAFFTLSGLIVVAMEYFSGEPGLTFGEHLALVWEKYAFFFLLMLATLPTFLYDTMKMSNRFAGPIMRLKSALNRLAEGQQVDNLTFRMGDFWGELSSDFNRVADKVRQEAPEKQST